MIVSGTGHRPNKLGGYSKKAFNHLVSIAEEWLKENKPSKVISGMALGWDQALAQAAINCKIPLIAAIPFKGQESAWPQESQYYYMRLLEKAENIHIISEGGYSPSKMQIRNEWMVDNSDLVLAMYDGTKGGTQNCIKYIMSKHNKQYINLYNKL